jgi:hypothetical protein
VPEQATPLAVPTPRDGPRRKTMKGILLWLIGIPIPIIILLYLFVFR